MNNKKSIILGIGLILLVGLISIIIITAGNRSGDTTDIRTGLETSKISTKTDSDGNITITNRGEGYELTLSEGWSIPPDGTELRKLSGLQLNYEPNPILSLTVFVLEATVDISLDEWVSKSTFFTNLEPEKIETVGGVLYRAEGGLYRDSGPFEQVLVENTGAIIYALNKGNKFYVVSCVAIGEGYADLIRECDKQIQSFTIL